MLQAPKVILYGHDQARVLILLGLQPCSLGNAKKSLKCTDLRVNHCISTNSESLKSWSNLHDTSSRREKLFRIYAMGKSLISALILLALSCSPVLAAKQALVFGVHPFKRPSEIYSMFRPLVKQLSKALNREVKLVIGKSYKDIIEKYKQGKVDFGYFDPAAYIMAHSESGVIPMARIKLNGKSNSNGVIVYRAGSKISSLSELQGKRFIFGDLYSATSHYAQHYMLMMAGVELEDLKKFHFTSNQDNVALNVLNYNFDAGAMKLSDAKRYQGQGLKVLALSQPIPGHLFAARNTLPPEVIKTIQASILKTRIKLLKTIDPAVSGVELAQDREYDRIRQTVNVVNHSDPVL